MPSVSFCRHYLIILCLLSICDSVISFDDSSSLNMASNDGRQLLSAPLMTFASDTGIILIETVSDSFSVQNNRLYSEWILPIVSCRSLLSYASEKGYTANENECQQRLSIYKKAFPSVEMNLNLIYDEIIIEKYLNFEIGIYPEIQNVNWFYREYLNNSPVIPPPTQTMLNPILNCRALLTMDTVKLLCNETRERHSIEKNKYLETNNKQWTLGEISLPLDSSLCLAENPENDKCIVTVGEFNQFLSFDRKNRRIPLVIARKMVLKKLLRIKICALKADTAGLISNHHFLTDMEMSLEDQLMHNEFINVSYNDSIEIKLREIYEKYYNSLFKEKITKSIKLIGTTDSVFLDSLMRSCMRKKLGVKSIPFNKTSLDSLPWKILTENELPDCFIRVIDTLKVGRISSIFRTPFGYFVCKLINSKRRREIPFRYAHQKVRYLFYMEQKLYNEKPDSILAFEYYNKNKKEFTTPDTLLLTAWLVPTADTSIMYGNKDNLTDSSFVNDTGTYNSLDMFSTDLPIKIQQELSKFSQDLAYNSEHIVPIYNNFGIWYFLIRKKIPGGKTIDFNQAKSTINNKLLIKSFPFDSIYSTESGCILKKEMILNNAYNQYVYNKCDSIAQTLSDEEINKLIANKKINIAYKCGKESDKRLLNIYRGIIRQKKEEEIENEIDKWLQSVRIFEFLLEKNPHTKLTD